jgi:uncharacterized membrane protein
MRNIAITYLTVLVVLTAVDFLWLGLVALDFYKKEIGSLMLEKPRLEVAALFYALYAAGITFLAVQPALTAGEWHKALLFGALFGLCAYGTYDLTNLATLQRWSFRLTVVDMAWGTFLTAIASLAGFLVGRWIGP